MARIMTIDVVLEAVRPYLNETSMPEVILLGHDSNFFAKERIWGLDSPIKVAYATWKSDVGDRVANLQAKPGVESKLRVIRESVRSDDGETA
jgi:hypothetical protein